MVEGLQMRKVNISQRRLGSRYLNTIKMLYGVDADPISVDLFKHLDYDDRQVISCYPPWSMGRQKTYHIGSLPRISDLREAFRVVPSFRGKVRF